MWTRSTSDEWSLEIVSQGYTIEFLSLPPDCFLCSPSGNRPSKRRILQQAIHHLLEIHAVERVPKEQRGTGVYSIFFVVPKRNDDWRSILDLKYVNHFIWLRHFHMESLKSITDALQQGDHMTSLDLTEAYLHVPIRPSHRRFLCFCIDGMHLQFKALPFGLSTAPRAFTKLLVNPVAYLRQQGFHIHPYLADLLICSSSYQQALQDTHTIMSCLHDHRFLINLQKSKLLPKQLLEHLGMTGHAMHETGFDTRQDTKDDGSSFALHTTSRGQSYVSHTSTQPPSRKHGGTAMGAPPRQGPSKLPEAVPMTNRAKIRPQTLSTQIG